MKTILKFCFILFLSPTSFTGFSQQYNSGIKSGMNGFIINLGGKFYFQPCEDSTKTLWESLDNRSFSLWYFRENLYLEAIENIGDSMLINYYDVDEKKQSLSSLKYFYCFVHINMMFLDNEFKIFTSPRFKLRYGNKEYPLYGFHVDNRIMKIIPKENKNLHLMYQYYSRNGYTIPEWLQELVKSSIK
jgi:hypothetical protein